MKKSLLFLFISLIGASAPEAFSHDRDRQFAVKTPVYRLYHQNAVDHHLTTKLQERDCLVSNCSGRNPGWRAEGVAFEIYKYQSPLMVPIFRCFNYKSGTASDHMISNASNCRERYGKQDYRAEQEHLGYVYSKPVEGASLPIFRCYKKFSDGGVNHFATLNPRECDNAGYTQEGPLGYVSSDQRHAYSPDHGAQFAVKTNVYRMYHSDAVDHHFTINRTERDHLVNNHQGRFPGWNDEGVSFRIYRYQSPLMVPIYRCNKSGVGAENDHMISNDSNCRETYGKQGYYKEDILGYVYGKPVDGAHLSLFRCYKDFGDGKVNHFATVNPRECDRAGYTREGPLGYVSNDQHNGYHE